MCGITDWIRTNYDWVRTGYDKMCQTNIHDDPAKIKESFLKDSEQLIKNIGIADESDKLKIIKEEAQKEFSELYMQKYFKYNDIKERYFWERIIGQQRILGRYTVQIPAFLVGACVGYWLDSKVQARLRIVGELKDIHKNIQDEYERYINRLTDINTIWNEKVQNGFNSDTIYEIKELEKRNDTQMRRLDFINADLALLEKEVKNFSFCQFLSRDLNVKLNSEQKKINALTVSLKARTLLDNAVLYEHLGEPIHALKSIHFVIKENASLNNVKKSDYSSALQGNYKELDKYLASDFFYWKGRTLLYSFNPEEKNKTKKNNHLKQTKECFEIAREINDKNFDAINGLGLAASFEGNKPGNESIKHFDHLISLVPDYAFAYNNRADYQMEQGNIKEAMLDIDKAILLEKNNQSFTITKAEIFIKKAEQEEKQKLGEKARESREEGCKLFKSVKLENLNSQPGMQKSYWNLKKICDEEVGHTNE